MGIVAMDTLRARWQQRFRTWALRGRPPEPVPIVFTQRRVYVLPTRAGLIYSVTLVVMLIGAINYTLSLGHALVFLLAGLGVATILATFRNLVHLRFTPGHCPPVFAGETARFGMLLDNVRSAPRLDLRLQVEGGPPTQADVPASSRVEVQLPLAAMQRGWLELPRVTVETRWPLGLVRTWGYLQPAQRCLVYPAPARDAPPLPSGVGNSQGRLERARGSDDFAGLRRHQPGETVHRIAWKAAARQPDADLQTKQFSDNGGRTLRLDWQEFPPSMTAETRLGILTRWALDAHAAGLAWSLHLPGKTLAADGGEAHLHCCLETLALHGTN